MTAKKEKGTGLSGWCLPGPNQHGECPGEFPSVICKCVCHTAGANDHPPKTQKEQKQNDKV